MNINDEALDIINERRNSNERQAKDNLSLAMQNSEFALLYRQYMKEVISQAKQGKMQNNIPKLQNKLNEMLKQLKIGAIIPKYSCPICQDLGYINGEPCQCLKKEINNILIEKSGFGKLVDFKDVKFDIFENPEHIKKLYSLMQKWCNGNFEKNIVYLGGDTGTGKTYLMRCMANELIKRGKLILLTTAFKLSQDCLKYHSSRDKDDGLLNQYLDCQVLFIDDLGTEVNLSPVTINYIYTIINERKMRNLPVVITSNLSLADIHDKYDERIYSRIADANSIKVFLTGTDLRLKNNK